MTRSTSGSNNELAKKNIYFLVDGMQRNATQRYTAWLLEVTLIDTVSFFFKMSSPSTEDVLQIK